MRSAFGPWDRPPRLRRGACQGWVPTRALPIDQSEVAPRQRLRTTLALAAAAAALAAFPRPSPATGTIDTQGATVAAGTAPDQGTVTINPSAVAIDAPALPANAALGSLGAMPGSIPPFAGGPVGLPVVYGQAGATLPGGTYNYSTYTITQGGIVTYGGPVTITTTGDVRIDGGLISTTAGGAGVSIVCGGNLQIVARQGVFTPGISTTGAASAVSVDVAGTITTTSADGSASWISAMSGPVNVITHSSSALLSLQNITIVSGSGGDATVQSSQALALLSSFVQANGGSAVAQAFGGPVVIQTGAVLGTNNAIVESAGPVTLSTASTVGGMNIVGVTAYAGDVSVSGSNVVQSGGTGDVTIRAADNVSVGAGSSVRNNGTGVVTLTAFGGTAKVEDAGSTTASTVRSSINGDTSVLATGDVVIGGASLVRSDQGAVRVRSVGGTVSLLGDSVLQAPNGAVDVRAGLKFLAQEDAALAGNLPAIDGASLLVGTGSGGISMACDPLTTQAGPIQLVSIGTVGVSSDLTANGALTITSTEADVSVVGRTLLTGAAGARSGDLTIASFGGSDATIDVSGSSIRSGDHATASGDVTIEVHAPAAPPSVDGTIVPSKIQVKTLKGSTDQRLTASGVIDFGGNQVGLLGVAKLTVGDLPFNFVFGLDGRGRGTYASDEVTLKITPSKLGSSRGTFRLSAVGDFSGFLDQNGSGTVVLAFERGAFKARGAADVTGGKFALGAVRGSLLEPGFRVAQAHGVVKDGAGDKLDLVLGFGGTEAAPSAAPDVTVSFGDTLSVTLPSSAFTETHPGQFTASDAAQGVKTLVVDYARETVTFKGRKIELGDVGEDATLQVTCTLKLGDDTRTFTFRMAHRGSALIY